MEKLTKILVRSHYYRQRGFPEMAEETQPVRQNERRTQSLWTMSEVARELGENECTYWYYVKTTGAIPAPEKWFGKKRYYSREAVEKIKAAYVNNGNRLRGIFM